MAMLAHRQLKCLSREAGGMLLGRRIRDSSDVIVDRITIPCQRDVRRRFLFVRDVASSQRIVEGAWAHSKGTEGYLGEWHTHPEDVPSPSSVDHENWLNVFVNTVIEFSELFFVIVGRRSTRMWEMDQDGNLSELMLVGNYE